MKRVLVINQGNTNNYGDIAINRTISHFLKDYFIVDYLPYWSENDIFGSLYSKYKILYKIIMKFSCLRDIFYLFFLKKRIKVSYEKVIIGGGELLSGHIGFNTAFYNIIKFFKKRSPIYVIGVNGNANLKKHLLKRYKKALFFPAKIMVRDYFTKDVLKNEYGIDANVYPDVVFSYRLVENDHDKEKKEGIIVLSPIEYWDEFGEYLGITCESDFINFLIEKTLAKRSFDEKIVVAPTVDTDNGIARKIYKKLTTLPGINASLEEFSSLEDYIAILKRASIVVSCRMHGLILALDYACTIESIAFKNKLAVFKKEYQDNPINISSITEKSRESLFNLLN